MNSRLLSRRTAVVGLLCISVIGASVVRWRAARGDDQKAYVDQHYPDFGFLPAPTDYKGRVFTLSQKHPKTEPAAAQRPEFLKTDIRKNWRDYLLAAQDYCFRDNVLGGDVANDFDVALRENPTWFHVSLAALRAKWPRRRAWPDEGSPRPTAAIGDQPDVHGRADVCRWTLQPILVDIRLGKSGRIRSIRISKESGFQSARS